jgi:hypothetical protein
VCNVCAGLPAATPTSVKRPTLPRACSPSLAGATLRGVTPEARRVLHALLGRVNARLDNFERRFCALERVVFSIDDLEARIAEQRPPTPLGGRELQCQRVEAVLRVRAEGFSHQKVADATGVSKAGVRRIIEREGDPAPERVRGINGKTFASHPSGSGNGREAR